MNESVYFIDADCRCLLGLVGTEDDKKDSHDERNADFTEAQATSLLNDNVTEWLNSTVENPKIPGEPDD